jgi:cyclophilin family peptidyl-prolyl cis-trans isomerase
MKFLNVIIFLLTVGLFFSCKKEVPPPVPDFTFTTDSMTVKFSATATNDPTTWEWDFGDSTTGTGADVSHTYNREGSFTVTLKTSNQSGSNNISKQINIGIKLSLISIKTSFGEMIIWMYDQTPKHKSNFLKLAKDNYFDSTTFHRIIKDFVIQGGDPNSKDSDPTNDGMGGPPYTIPMEYNSKLKHDYGAVGSASTSAGGPSSGSQFYIVVNKAGDHFLDGSYTVFGMVIKGMEVADKIAIQSKDANDRPTNDIRMYVDEITMTRTEIHDQYGYDISQ